MTTTHRHAELRGFLQARRASIAPQDVGLPSGGRRRTPGLRREEVAVRAGVGVSWYTWLEQGRDIKVSPAVLDAVAAALLLGEPERVHLYRLAGVNPPPPAAAPAVVTEEFVRLVRGWSPNPAYVVDRHWTVLLSNLAAQAVFGLADGTNCLRAFFTDGAYRARHRDAGRLAPAVVAQFRRDAARFPDDPGFAELAGRLRAASLEFAELWDRHEVAGPSVRAKEIDHPAAGPLRFELSVLQLPSHPDVRLLVHSPSPGTAVKLRDLVAEEPRDLVLAG